jgi:hypothetical protein
MKCVDHNWKQTGIMGSDVIYASIIHNSMWSSKQYGQNKQNILYVECAW